MAQVIIYANEKGGVSTTYPTGEISIEAVLAKDCPEGAIIVDESVLPTENDFYDAWELVDGRVIVNETKKQAIIDAKQAPINAKVSAISKLTALGLTETELKALVG
jgi:hypothetical protein